MKSSIETKNGVKYVAVDGKIIDTLSFRSCRPTKNNVSDFYKAGVRIFHVFCSGLPSGMDVPYSLYGETWFGDGDYRFENLDRQIEFFLECAPEAYVFINVHLDVRNWWLEENPGRTNSFTHLSQIAGDEKWRRDTAEYLKALIRHVEGKYNDRVCGYFLLGGYHTEWFSQFDCEESHPIKLEAYRKYMQDDTITIPTKEELEKPEEQIFLDPVESKNVITYRKFHSGLIADLVCYYAHQAQEVLNHEKVVGVFFGYVMELLHERIWNVGHFAMDKVYQSPDIDLIGTPSSYQFRGYDEPGTFMLCNETLGLNNKMYFISFDHRTFLVPNLVDNPRRICGDPDTAKALETLGRKRWDHLPTRERTICVLQRDFMQRLYKRSGTWWFDMLEGWFYDDGLMNAIESMVTKSNRLMGKERRSNSEVAVFLSCESLYYVNKCSKMNDELLVFQRGALGRMGAPYDLFSMNDLERVDVNQYKLFIFLDAYYLTENQRNYMNQVIKAEGRSVLFIGACDYVNDDGFSKERMEQMAGMKLGRLEKDEATISAYDSLYGYEAVKTPTWYVEDEEAAILGRYAMSRECGLAKKQHEEYTAYFSGVGNLSANALREIARQAGVHIYTENGNACYVNSGMAGVYNTKGEVTRITLPFDGEFEEFFSGKKYQTVNGVVDLPTGENPTQLLIINREE